jgi:hypothetical protein
MGVNALSFSTEVSQVRKEAGYKVKRIWSCRFPLQGMCFPLDFLGSSNPFPLNSDWQFLSNIILFLSHHILAHFITEERDADTQLQDYHMVP